MMTMMVVLVVLVVMVVVVVVVAGDDAIIKNRISRTSLSSRK